MKSTIFAIAISAITIAACNNNNKSDKMNRNSVHDTIGTSSILLKDSKNLKSSSIDGIVSSYLQMKNAFTNDEGKVAATAASAMLNTFKNFDETSLTAEQKKKFEDIKDDASENAEHISVNGNNIKHQREHFGILSKDIYDLVKALGAGQTLYQDYCPMYNNKEGATWLSETKEIKNPYMGKGMATCGSVKEIIKP